MKIFCFIFFLYQLGSLCGQATNKQYEGYMKGNGDLVGIEMKFAIQNDSVQGIYYYQSIGVDLMIKGSIRNNVVTLFEHNSAGKTTGIFNGKLYEDGDSIVGSWIRKKDSSNFSFSIRNVEWKDYKLIKRTASFYRNKKIIADERMVYDEWLEMSGNPDTTVQKKFNQLISNIPAINPDPFTLYGKGFYGIEKDGMTYYYTKYKESTLMIKTNEFISFGNYHSDFWGEWVDNKKGYHFFDLQKSRLLHLTDLLRKDTTSFLILRNWIKASMEKEGKWAQFQADFGNLTDYLNETKPSNLEQFYVKEDGIYFFFCRLPYSNIFSIEDVKIPFNKLVQILDKESCLYKWIIKCNKLN